MYEARHESLETSQSGVTDILVAGDPILVGAFHDLVCCLVLVGSRVQGKGWCSWKVTLMRVRLCNAL
jgi:hypothetical protein